MESNTANFFQYNDEALLKVLKMGAVTSQDIAEMKEKGAIILEDGGDIQWLIKEVSDTALENYKKRLREDMHIFSAVPNLTDANFGGNLSGVAMSYKLWGLEQICAIKERKFKRGLQRRIELITHILNIKGGQFDYRDIDIQFRRNKPQNVLEIAQIITMLSGELSRETRLQMLPTIDNVQDELQKLEEEKQQEVNSFGQYNALAQALTQAKAAWEAEQQEKQRLAKLPPEERAKAEGEAQAQELTKLRTELLQRDLKDAAVKKLTDEGFPVGLADLLTYTDKESMEKSLQQTQEVFKSALEAAVKERLRGKTPEGLGGGAKAENTVKDQIAQGIRGGMM